MNPDTPRRHGAEESLLGQAVAYRDTYAPELLFPIAQSAAFAKSIPHATFVAVEGAAHSFPAESPQDFTQHVLRFLA